jgi:DNA-binding transcriptional MerR regulator
MTRNAPALVLTAGELLDVVASLEPLNGDILTARKLRYLDRHLRHLSARSADVTNQARLYTAQDVALVRVFLRLMRRGLPAWQARAVLALRNRELRRALESDAALMLVVDWPDVHVVQAPEASRFDVRVSLRSVLTDVEGAIARRRHEEPDIWVGWMSMPAAVAARELRDVRPALAYA